MNDWSQTPSGQTASFSTIVQQGMQKLAIYNWDENMIFLFDWLDKSTPSQPQIIQQLKTNHKMQLAVKVIQKTEVAHLKKKTSEKKGKLTKTTDSNY